MVCPPPRSSVASVEKSTSSVCTSSSTILSKINHIYTPFHALSLALTVFAQILCTYCYKEQWILWLVLDIIQVIMFILIGNYLNNLIKAGDNL